MVLNSTISDRSLSGGGGGGSKETVTILKSTGQTVVYQIKGKAMFKTVLNERKFILTKTARFIFVGVDKVPLQ